MEGLVVILNRLGICYTHKKEGRKIIWAADSYLVVRFNDGIPAKDIKQAHSHLVVEGSWSLDLE